MSDANGADTRAEWYADRLHRGVRGWRTLVPNPYRSRLRRLTLGRVLDVGCGVGRCLRFVDGNGVGIDHNPTSVAVCRADGLEAYVPEDFDPATQRPFDTILLSHVLEHLDAEEGTALVRRYLPLLRPGGRVMLITPQAAGQRSDPTHVREVGPAELTGLLGELGAETIQLRSFPFPAAVGRVFRHNENQAIGTFA